MAFDYNPITGQLDLVGASSGGSSVIDGEVSTRANLPITLGTPAVGDTYLVREASGVWLVNYYPAGLYRRAANDGELADWVYLGVPPTSIAAGPVTLEATSNTLLTFKVVGSDGVTRSVAFPIS